MKFDPIFLESMIGGLNTLDVPHLVSGTESQARAFIAAYGYDLDNEKDLNRVWSFHRKAITYIQTELLKDGEEIPDELCDREKLGSPEKLICYSSQKDHPYSEMACGILKVIHAFVHLNNDLFNFYSTEIQEQILRPIQAHIVDEPASGVRLGSGSNVDSVLLKKFEVKPFKTTSSSVTKLLAKPNLVAFSLMDKMGVRFITKSLADVFRVVRYLTDENIVCFAHNIPDQSINTLYPLNLFLEVVEHHKDIKGMGNKELEELLKNKLSQPSIKPEYKEKENSFTSENYKFIKFITRRLVKVSNPEISFFYPYEIQIVDYDTYINNMTGEAAHDQYKKRQVERARLRVLGRKAIH